MFLRQALRYRWSQSLVLAGISLLIGACAVFAPWFARAVEQTVMTETLSKQWLESAWQLEATAPRFTDAPASKPEDLDQLVPADVRPLFTPPLHGMDSDVAWRTPSFGQDPSVPGKLIWRDGYCEQLTVVEGRCPQAPNEVIAGVKDKTTWEFKVGTVLAAHASDGGLKPDAKLTVVGFYEPKQARGEYWYGRTPVSHSRRPVDKDPGSSDFLFATRDTLSAAQWVSASTMDTRPMPHIAQLDDLTRMADATRMVNGNAAASGQNATNTSALVTVIEQLQTQRHQATTIIPLVMVQVALFAVVVLAFALAAVVDQRRPEIALSRLRGASARRTGRSMFAELGLPVLIGTVSGIAAGFGILLIVRATWLRYGAPLELPWTVPVAAALALVVALVVVLIQVRGAVRQPISALLRRVAPRRRGTAIAVADLCIIVFAVAGLFAALTGDGHGPLPVLTPALLALAVGLTFAYLLLPTAGLISRRAARRGRLGLALGALQVSRRPVVTRIVAAVAVAGALLAFAGQAASVGAHNREIRSGYETGAEGVLKMNALDLGDFTRAVDRIDPDRHWLTPVVESWPPSPDALKSMLIEPDSFRRIAFRGDQLTDAEGWKLLEAPSELKPIQFRSAQLTVTASTGQMKQIVARDQSGEPIATGKPKSVLLRANVVSLRNGARYLVTFPPMKLAPGKPQTLQASVDCLGGCQLLRLGIGREALDQAGLQGDVTISKLSSDDHPSIQLGTPNDWKTIRATQSDPGSVTPKAGGLLTLATKSLGNDQYIQYATVPPVIPALVSPEYHWADGTTTSPALDGTPMTLTRIDRLRGPVNRYSDRTAVADLETARRLGGSVDEGATDFELWLNADGMAHADAIIDQLGKSGFEAELTGNHAERIDEYSRSASALALQLTPLVGIAGWALAIVVLLLTVVTTWRSRTQDYASLRITGVPAGTTGRAARWEQTGPVVLAVLLGSVCGVIGAKVALPLIPLFADPGGPVPLDLSINWPVAILLWLIGTAVLAATTLLLGTGVNRRSSYSRIREDLT
ncbi:FtsX-like permease family protein [Kribbella sp. NPDC026611]|uniref:FtsX-like permease family protein n=1 Tax=Kribbella sp. NPDC026611 TaxID=3154911 RepID=UPI0033F9B9DC